VARQIDLGIEKLSGRFRIRKFIAYFQSYTNTYAPVERLSEIYDAACEREEIVGIAVGTRPDCVPDGVLRLLADIATRKPVWVEYGLQSIHARTLELINRGHGPDAFFDAVRRTASYDLPVVAHLILGLPGETVEDMRETARVVGRSGVWGVKLHHLYVIEGSRLARLYHEGLYRPMTLDEAVDAVCAVLEELPPEVVIHRLTSDPHREELVAPQWMTARSEVRQAMDHALKKRNLRQGSALGV
jgi:radical SAM protein (TIGR01212 family)